MEMRQQETNLPFIDHHLIDTHVSFTDFLRNGMQARLINKLINNFIIAIKNGGAMALPAPPVAPPLDS